MLGHTVRRHKLAIIAGLAILLVLIVVLSPKGPPMRPDRLPFGGQPYFWAGVNYPWKSYQDFGNGAWGHSGVSEKVTYDEIDTDFTNMAAQGIRIVKWRLFNDGRYSPKFDDKGFATGLVPEFYADLDAALAIAKKHDIYLVFSLFNSQLWATDCTRQGVRFGWGPVIVNDPARRSALIHKGVEPFLRHIAGNDRVLAFEVIAEPEWGIDELHTEQDFRLKVPLNDVRAFVRDVVRSIHSNTKALATVEANRPTHMQYWQGLGLDYYTFSWYDWMAPYDPLDVPASSYGFDRPIVLGEFPIATSEYYSIDQALDISYRQGYAGAFGWSFGADDKYSRWEDARQAVTDWLTQHWSEVALDVQRASLPSDAPPVPPPYARSGARLHVERGILVTDVDISVRGGGDFVAKFFLYPGDGSSTEPLAEREHFVAVPEGRPQLISAIFDGLNEGQLYKVSLGIFDRQQKLLKWFDGLANFSVKDGKVELSRPTQEQIENPCYGASG